VNIHEELSRGPFVEGVTKEIQFKNGGHAYWKILEHQYTGGYWQRPAPALDVGRINT
jgi:hypothetical protein